MGVSSGKLGGGGEGAHRKDLMTAFVQCGGTKGENVEMRGIQMTSPHENYRQH